MTTNTDIQRKLHLVVQSGLSMAGTDDLRAIVQSATDTGLELCGAQFGAFFYNVVDSQGARYQLSTLSSADPDKLSAFPIPRDTAVFAPTFESVGIIRSPDITRDPRYGKSAPYLGLPVNRLLVHSYLAVPVKGQSGEVLGALFYGHELPARFDQDSEELVSTIAAQAAIAIQNHRLRQELVSTVNELRNANLKHKEVTRGLGELAAIVESSDDAIISKDLNGIVTSWNQAATRILGYSRDEMIGASILKLIPPELHKDETLILQKIRAGERIQHFETIRISKSGARLPVSLTISPLRDPSGQIIGASKILRDISAKRALESSLIQAEKIAATGRLAATIAHEINNPLEAVTNLLYLAKQDVGSPRQQQYIEFAESEIARISHIAKQTLGYYRESSAAGPASIERLLDQAISVYQPRCKSMGIEIQTHIDSSPSIFMRRGEIMQVISNLIANAMQAMPYGGVLRIESHNTADSVSITVTDNGTGIPDDSRSRIFDAFFTTRKDVGTGIGLFVSRQFVEGHGGSINVESSTAPQSHGTAFSVTLPRKIA
jgi:PAS domain S-box-containing protein